MEYFNLPKNILNKIMLLCDFDKDGRIEKGSEEEKSFINAIFSYDKSNYSCKINDITYRVTQNSVFCLDNEEPDFLCTDNLTVSAYSKAVFETTNTYKKGMKIVTEQEAQDKANIKKLMAQEATKRKVNPDTIDFDYWMNKIYDVSKLSKLPFKIIVAIMARESNGKFNKNVNSVNGKGPMQITTISVKDFFPNATGNRFALYEEIDKNLLYDILYEKDENGNLKKDANGNMILKYKTPQDLVNACANDDEFGIKVGALIFKIKYAIAISSMTKCSLKQSIKDINDNNVDINTENHEKALKLAFYKYNGNPAIQKRYSEDVIDSLKNIHNFNFEYPMA